MELKDKIALVTGGTKGIGYYTASEMLKSGMKVTITGRTDASVQKSVSELSEHYPDRVIGYAGDVSNHSDMENTVKKIVDKWGGLDVLIANAGVGHFAKIQDMTIDQWNETINVNLTGVFNSVKASINPLTQSKGYIITIASLAGTNFFARGAAYNASKFGLVGMTQAMMMDLRSEDIKCSTIMPGSVSTHFNGNEPSDKDAWKIQPEDIGQIVIDLLKMPARTLPSKVEVRPTKPPQK
jgi:NAD(P)-dependent dehydrogenase (short-subunit alcohol dehydrogenase family)